MRQFRCTNIQSSIACSARFSSCCDAGIEMELTSERSTLISWHRIVLRGAG